MENRLQATFMPRQPAMSGDPYARPKGPANIFMLVGVLAFFLAAGSWGGLYAYKKIIVSSNESKKIKVQEAINNFEPELTRQLTVIKTRSDIGKNLLDNHKAFTFLFDLFELNTAQVVQFTEISYSVMPDKGIEIKAKGEARSYNAIAFQSSVFSKIEQFKNPIFSNLSLGDTGIISFDFTAGLDPSAVLYNKMFPNVAPLTNTGSNTPVAPNASTTPTATTTAPVASTTPFSTNVGTSTASTTRTASNPPRP